MEYFDPGTEKLCSKDISKLFFKVSFDCKGLASLYTKTRKSKDTVKLEKFSLATSVSIALL